MVKTSRLQGPEGEAIDFAINTIFLDTLYWRKVQCVKEYDKNGQRTPHILRRIFTHERLSKHIYAANM